MKKLLLLILLSVSISIQLQFLLFNQTAVYASQTSTYKIGPKDILQINVLDEPELSKSIPVDSDGFIKYPFMDVVYVAGLTVKQIYQKIITLLGQDYLMNPQVEVTVKEFNSQKVMVFGEVARPGYYILTAETTLLGLISQAGGLTPDKKILIYRRPPDIASDSGIEEIEPIILDINQLLQSGNPTGSITLASSDMICLMNEKEYEETFLRGQQVYITGQIKKPGAYKYRNDLTALSLCLIAEGFTESAAPNRATIIRNNGDEIHKINLNKVKKGKAVDFMLMAGDRINIPESFW